MLVFRKNFVYVLNKWLVKQIHFLVNINICKTHCPCKLIYRFSDIFYVCLLIMPDVPFKRRWIINFEVKLWLIIWWLFLCNEECAPDSITKFVCEGNIKSMQEDEFLVWSVDSLISCCSPNWEIMTSIFEPSYDVLSLLHQRFDLTLKSPRTTV